MTHGTTDASLTWCREAVSCVEGWAYGLDEVECIACLRERVRDLLAKLTLAANSSPHQARPKPRKPCIICGAAALGRKGGKAGTGASKRRGDSAYYKALRLGRCTSGCSLWRCGREKGHAGPCQP